MSTLEMQEIAALKQRIFRLEAQVDQLYRHLSLTFVEQAEASDDPRIIEALRRNNIIEAVKYYREVTGVSLEAAKAAVDEIRARRGI
ncbi:MAG TPA: hypothetical protein PKL78_01710 [Anaerolineales bacterium]|nr:hypothetical protein [Anaerolineales bacterium]HNN12244.1 hypothetical protein [Anaerolineales bacterium]